MCIIFWKFCSCCKATEGCQWKKTIECPIVHDETSPHTITIKSKLDGYCQLCEDILFKDYLNAKYNKTEKSPYKNLYFKDIDRVDYYSRHYRFNLNKIPKYWSINVQDKPGVKMIIQYDDGSEVYE